MARPRRGDTTNDMASSPVSLKIEQRR